MYQSERVTDSTGSQGDAGRDCARQLVIAQVAEPAAGGIQTDPETSDAAGNCCTVCPILIDVVVVSSAASQSGGSGSVPAAARGGLWSDAHALPCGGRCGGDLKRLRQAAAAHVTLGPGSGVGLGGNVK